MDYPYHLYAQAVIASNVEILIMLLVGIWVYAIDLHALHGRGEGTL